MWVAGRMSARDLLGYVIAQCLGAIVAAGVLYLIASGKPGWDIHVSGLGQDGYGAHSPGSFSMQAGLLFEVVATFLFVLVVLGSTEPGAAAPLAGLAIGGTLAGIHIVGIQVTGVSVNPARSLGPALFVGGDAMAQLWLFIIAPLIGGALAGLAFRSGLFGVESLRGGPASAR
jgi:aquaporin Z